MDANARSLELAILQGDHAGLTAKLNAHPSLLNSRFYDNLELTPLMWACRNRRDRMAAELICRGADVSAINRIETDGDGGNTALWFTGQGAAEGNTTIANLLIDAGADVNRRCEHGQTALYIAADWVHLDLVQYLVERGADPMIPDNNGHTPLDRVTADLQSVSGQPSLTVNLRRFVEGAPMMLEYLRSLTAR